MHTKEPGDSGLLIGVGGKDLLIGELAMPEGEGKLPLPIRRDGISGGVRMGLRPPPMLGALEMGMEGVMPED